MGKRMDDQLLSNESIIAERINHAVDQHCPAYTPDPYRVQRVLRQAQMEGETKVKKKLSVGMIFAIALMLAAITALAIGLGIDEIWQDSFEKMNTTGEIDTICYPEEGDMTAEEAIELAREAIVAKYGTKDAEFDNMGVYPRFFAHGYDEEAPDAPAEWRIYFSSQRDIDIHLSTLDYGPDGAYRVYLNAETKEITLCLWYTDNFWSHAQRIWDCGSYDEVYFAYHQPEFYNQTIEQQAHFTRLLSGQGYAVRSEAEKYDKLLRAAELSILFRPVEEAASNDDPLIAAAWAALQQAYGLDPALMQQYAYAAYREDWHTGTDDVTIVYSFEEEFRRQEAGLITDYCCRLFADARRVGAFMVSFAPGTTDMVNIAYFPYYESQREERVTEGKLLEKTEWTMDDLAAFDQAYQALALAEQRLELADAAYGDRSLITQSYLLSLGADENFYEAAPADCDFSGWFLPEDGWNALTETPPLPYTAIEAQYGSDYRFWPMESLAWLHPYDFSCPREGEMTQAEAEALAIDAVIDAHGQSALDALGEYTTGCMLFRHDVDGELLEWHVYITDDPAVTENGFEVIFTLRDGELAEGPLVRGITEGGNG